MKFLVIQTGKLGDMVCTTPVFRAIRRAYPDASLSVAGNALNKEILRGNPYITEYFDIKGVDVSVLRNRRFDAAILLTPNAPVARMLVMARISRIIVPQVVGGYSPYMSFSYRFWSLFATRVPHRMHHYAPGEYLRMLVPLGIETSDTRKELFVDEEVQKKIDSRLARHGVPKVAIAPRAGNKIKEWPLEYFHTVAKALVERGAYVVIVGGPGDKGAGQAVSEGLSNTGVWDATGELSVEELKATVRRMNLFVSADTGPIYIAEAFNVPTLDIVGPVDEREQPPIAPPRHIVIVPERDKPQLHIMNARVYDATEARRQAEAVKPERVLSAIDDLLAAVG